MRIDAYTHFFPAKYFQRLMDSKVPDIGKRVREVPAISDVDVRRKIVSSFPDYRPLISGAPTARGEAEEAARIAEEGVKQRGDRYPDEFAGFIAEVPLPAPDAGIRESERA